MIQFFVLTADLATDLNVGNSLTMRYPGQDPTRQSRNQDSDYLSQRRKGRKGRKNNGETILQDKSSLPSELGVPWRLGGRNFRITGRSTSGIFKRHAMTNMLVLVFG
jgi:hypothetical protein